jgi:hypothetical protein
VLPSGALKLDTLANVRSEMARLYRLGLAGKLPSDELTRFVYCLREIRCCVEAATLDQLHQRLTELAAKLAGKA